jgi:hypothetical protein
MLWLEYVLYSRLTMFLGSPQHQGVGGEHLAEQTGHCPSQGCGDVDS